MRAFNRMLRGRVPSNQRPLASIIKGMFTNGEQGVWYDPSDFERYMSALGPELVTNGDFSRGTTGWSGANGGVLSVANGEITVTNEVSSVGRAAQMIATEIGKTYRLTAQARIGSATFAQLGWGTVLGSVAGGSVTTTSTTATTLSMTFVATTTSTGVAVGNGSATTGNTSIFDNISVRELTAIDTATLFQDAAGTIPVTAVGQPVGLMLDKSKGLVLGAELASIGSQSVQNGSGKQTSGVWSVTATGAFAGVRQATVFNAGSLYRITGSWSGNTNGRAIIINFGGVGGIATLGTADSGTINGYYFAGNTPVNIQIYAGNSVAGDTFSFSLTSIRELPGNHAIQTTATSRPVLSARVNLLTQSEFRNGVTDANVRGGLVTAATMPGYLGALEFGYDGTTSTYAYKSDFALQNVTQIIRVVVRMGDGLPPVFGSTAAATDFTLVIGGSSWGVSATSYQVKDLGTGLYAVSAVLPVGSINVNNSGVLKVAQNSSRTFKVTAYDLRPANTGTNLPDYQRVNTATDYDTAGFPYFLRMDGVDDFLVTPSIDFTGTDKMMVSAGVRRLADTASQMIVEMGTNGESVAGSWFLAAQYSASYNLFANSLGVPANGRATAFLQGAAPTHDVVSFRSDLAGSTASDRLKFRRNSGTFAAATATGSAGTGGTYGNYPLYIGRRGGTSMPFNGHLYGLIIRGAATSDAQIKSVERYINGKTRAY